MSKRWSILFIGDAMCHDEQRRLAQNSISGKFDFSGSFKYLYGLFHSYDYVACNMETVINNGPYTGFPKFCSPTEFALSLIDSNVNMFFLANNHICDKGKEGCSSTINCLRDCRIDGKKQLVTGVYVDKFEDKDKSILIRGVGIINYSDVMNCEIPDGVKVNTIDEESIKKDIEFLKSQGATYIIAYVHWGKEYERHHSDRQREVAEMFVRNGVNFIIGGHPHVIQDYEVINGVPVFYSLGNFISSQKEQFRTDSFGVSFTFVDDKPESIKCIPFKTDIIDGVISTIAVNKE